MSVIIPTFNRARILGDAIESLFAQTYRSWELIVVDDGSTDDTEAVLRPFRGRLKFLRTAHGGPGAARNVGLRHARGTLVAWLDSDDVWAPDKLALQVAILQEDPDCVLVSSDFWAFDDGGVTDPSHIASYYGALEKVHGGIGEVYPTRRSVRFEGPGFVEAIDVFSGDVREKLLLGSWVHPPTVLMRRTAMKAAGDIDETLSNVMEYEFFLRLARQGPFSHIDRPLAGYRHSPDQLSGDAHLLTIRLELLRIVEDLARREGALPGGRTAAYRRRLGQCNAGVARAASARNRRWLAAGHLLRAARLGVIERDAPRVVARILLPDRAVRYVRRLSGDPSRARPSTT